MEVVNGENLTPGGEPEGESAPKPTKRRRLGLEVARDRRLMVELRLLQRMSLNDIAEEINAQYVAEVDDPATGLNKEGKFPPHISWQQVKKDLEQAKEEFKEEEFDDIAETRLQCIRGLTVVKSKAYQAFEISRKPQVVQTEEERDSEDKGLTKIDRSVTHHSPPGDPRFLKIVEDCEFKIAELKNAIPPKKIAASNFDGSGPFSFSEDEELKRLMALAQEVMGMKNQKLTAKEK